MPGQNSPDPSNTMPPLSTNNGSRNIYGCIFDVFKLTSEQRQQHAVMVLQHYHDLCNKDDHSSMFVSPPPIPNIESLSKCTISSLDSGSLGRNQADVNIKQQTALEVANTDKLVADNEELDPPPPQDILNVFVAADLLSSSLSDSAKYKHA